MRTYLGGPKRSKVLASETRWLIELGTVSVATLVAVTTAILHRRNAQLVTKMAGSLLTLSLALAADNAAVYALAIFIVATLVTELGFLEKLAALLWNRDKYWEYLLKNALPSEIEAKRAEDAAENIAEDDGAGARKRVQVSEPFDVRRALEFERQVIDALPSLDLCISQPRVRSHVKVVAPGSFTQVFDAIVESPDAHLVVEVKYYQRPRGITSAIAQVTSLAATYEKYLRERGLAAPVVPVLALPRNMVDHAAKTRIPIIAFDTETRSVVNEARLRDAITTFLGGHTRSPGD